MNTFRIRYLLLAAAILCIGTVVLAADAPPAPVGPSDYRIGIDDVLDVTVWNTAELQRTVPVRPDGKISLPLVNDVQAAGLTPMELRDQLAKKLAAFVHSPDVSVVVREIHSLKVSVIGQVRNPGRYDLRGPLTVLDALAMSGGFTEFAGRRKITIIRSAGIGVQHIRFDYDDVVSDASVNNNVLLRAGDIVVVP